MSVNRVWESVECIDGNFVGFIYQIKRIAEDMWHVNATFHGPPPIHITLVSDSPGEALTKMAQACLAKSPVKSHGK